MKTKLSLPKWSLGVLLFLVAATLMLSSCLKDENHYSVQAAGMALINASPGSPALDLVADGDRIYLASKFSYDTVIPYTGAYPGYRVFGMTRHNAIQLLGSQQFYLEPGNAYSLFTTDTIGKMKLVCLSDSLDATDSTLGNVRFANMSADAPALNLVLKASETHNMKNIAYSKATEFETIKPATNYTAQLIETSNNKVLATKTNISIEKGHAYTFWAKGIFESTSDSTQIGISMMQNR